VYRVSVPRVQEYKGTESHLSEQRRTRGGNGNLESRISKFPLVELRSFALLSLATLALAPSLRWSVRDANDASRVTVVTRPIIDDEAPDDEENDSVE